MDTLSLGRRIRAARRAKEWTQEELARRINVARPTIASWETDRAEPGADDLVALGARLGVTVDYLVGSPEPSAPGSAIDWPAGVAFLRRASTELTPEMKRKMIKAMEQFLEDDNADSPE